MSVKVKICGIATEAAMNAAIRHGADYVGLVNFPKSPRHVDLPVAARLAAHARALSETVKVVMLLVDPDDRKIQSVRESVKPDVIQLHGKETPDRVGVARAHFGRDVWKAVSVASHDDVVKAAAFTGAGNAAMILFDAKPPADPASLPGGNGLSFDWTMLDGWDHSKPFALAGGLSPDNVAEAVQLTGAAVVDVSSGVESAPGLKDEALIRLFIARAKAATKSS
jgi:phosphoribosylanthranilate isomerase